MFTDFDFLKYLGWANWIARFLNNEMGEDWTFADLVFETVPAVLQLFAVIWLMNWIMGFIYDFTKRIGGGGR